jgi:Protein of unknown function (DUF1350)
MISLKPFTLTKPSVRAARRTHFSTRCAQKIDLARDVIAIAPSRARPRGIVHFLGGAFAGAAPYLFYSSIIDRIADSGYTVVVTPYSVTFQHDRCARNVHTAFINALQELRQTPKLTWTAPVGAPTHGVGHSNGALMHAMIGSLIKNPINTSNVLVSFNNRQVSEAVPLPLDPLQALVQPVRGDNRLESMAKSAVGQILSTAEEFGAVDSVMRKNIEQIIPAATQLGSVFDEVGDGSQDFTPSPEENERLFERTYNVPRTLLVQFEDDNIDQSIKLEQVLQRRVPRGGVERMKMIGNHLTPVGASPQIRVPGAFGPAEAIAQAALSLSQADLRRAGQQIVSWMDAN